MASYVYIHECTAERYIDIYGEIDSATNVQTPFYMYAQRSRRDDFATRIYVKMLDFEVQACMSWSVQTAVSTGRDCAKTNNNSNMQEKGER